MSGARRPVPAGAWTTRAKHERKHGEHVASIRYARETDHPPARSPPRCSSRSLSARAVFQLEEATIAGVHAAMKAGRLTCAGLVDQYLDRIEAHDKRGPALNAITVVNPDARQQAAALDQRYKASGPAGPLHCVPFIVKDNFETTGLQTAAGSLALKDFDPGRDAFQVKRIKEAGAIIVAKSNMAEWAFSPYETVNSLLPGYTRNPYALDRVTAGSSGGTAAAVAANFGLAGLGSDTGNSIRGPSSHQALVGIRSTMGLTSRAGVVPLSLLADIAGPMTRTVEDAVAVFEVIVGEDPNDPITLTKDFEPAGLRPSGRPAASVDYRAALMPRRSEGRAHRRPSPGLRARHHGRRDRQGLHRCSRGSEEGRRDHRRSGPGRRSRTRSGARETPGPAAASSTTSIATWPRWATACPVKNLEDIIRSRRFHPSIEMRLTSAQAGSENGLDSAACKAEADYRERYRTAVAETMKAHELAGVRLPDVEQSAAADRRPEHAARRQQPGVLADDRMAGDPGADGIHARWDACPPGSRSSAAPGTRRR